MHSSRLSCARGKIPDPDHVKGLVQRAMGFPLLMLTFEGGRTARIAAACRLRVEPNADVLRRLLRIGQGFIGLRGKVKGGHPTHRLRNHPVEHRFFRLGALVESSPKSSIVKPRNNPEFLAIRSQSPSLSVNGEITSLFPPPPNISSGNLKATPSGVWGVSPLRSSVVPLGRSGGTGGGVLGSLGAPAFLSAAINRNSFEARPRLSATISLTASSVISRRSAFVGVSLVVKLLRVILSSVDQQPLADFSLLRLVRHRSAPFKFSSTPEWSNFMGSYHSKTAPRDAAITTKRHRDA